MQTHKANKSTDGVNFVCRWEWVINVLPQQGNPAITEETAGRGSPQCHHMSVVDFVVLPPGHGRSVTDFWGWDAQEAQLSCPDGVWVAIEGDVVPGGALNLNSTNLPRPWSPRESSPSKKTPTVEPGIGPWTSWLVVRESDHYTTRLVGWERVSTRKLPSIFERS